MSRRTWSAFLGMVVAGLLTALAWAGGPNNQVLPAREKVLAFRLQAVRGDTADHWAGCFCGDKDRRVWLAEFRRINKLKSAALTATKVYVVPDWGSAYCKDPEWVAHLCPLASFVGADWRVK